MSFETIGSWKPNGYNPLYAHGYVRDKICSLSYERKRFLIRREQVANFRSERRIISILEMRIRPKIQPGAKDCDGVF
ncbi:hypothetical protein SAE01_43010 [Segetibacter aerophilus]|uniref:Uncharacterized protein n=1 Tax=Segetibacter aerophilus TaxID=670293 RepID=A0A512BIV5_9BACT|nr:hypothetical protein SAE01_43010 [Segetibacter aerophilus]